MGYLLTSDTSHQKLMLLVGPPRSGKGTICRITEQVIGADNVVWPTLSDLAERFGLASLLGKLAAIIADAHLVRDQSSSRTVEVLKSITGEDAVRVDRKNRDAIPNARIIARFFICANELPQLPDASSALTSRLLLLRMRKSFVGQEDRSLSAALVREIPGIMRWALDGLARLRTGESFTIPQDSLALAREFEFLSSPIKEFLSDCCVVGHGKVEMAVLYQKFRGWCDVSGRKPLSRPMFGAKLRAAVPQLEESRLGAAGGLRTRFYVGVALAPENSLGEDMDRIDAL